MCNGYNRRVVVAARALNCCKMFHAFEKLFLPEHSATKVEECSGCNGYIFERSGRVRPQI